jgi:hypothetical protein
VASNQTLRLQGGGPEASRALTNFRSNGGGPGSPEGLLPDFGEVLSW